MQDTPEYREQIPATIGRYKVESVLGYGAMGAVYKAFDPLIKRTLAIKTLRLDVVRNSPQYKSFIDRFNHEARISGTLSHPNIVTLFDIGEEGGLPFLAMEYVAGETIAAIIERGERFAPERIVGLVSQVASAIDYAHSRTVVHRDIKPSNLIISDGDRVKVTDFGIAKLADTEMTQSGVLLGTPSYMSPEQAMGEPLDGRSDIFSLGVCAFEMLSGEQPFPGTNVTSILYKLVHVDPIEPPNLEMSGLVPEKWREVFGKVLAKKPDARYQSAAEFVQDLELCLGAWFGSAMAPDDLDQTLLTTEAMPVLDSDAPTILGRRQRADDDDEIVPAMLPLDPEPEELPATLLLRTPLPDAAAEAAQDEAGAGETADLHLAQIADAKEGRAGPPPIPPGSSASHAEEEPSAEERTVLIRRDAPAPSREPDLPSTTALPILDEPLPPTTYLPAPTPPASSVAPPPPRKPSAPVTVTTPAAARPAAVTPPRRSGPSSLLLVAVGVVGILAVAVMTVIIVNLLRRPEPVEPPPVVAMTPEPTPVPLPETTEGTLRITSEPEGAAITVNGEARGDTPSDLRLPLGLYDVQLSLKGYLAQERSVELTESSPEASLALTLQRPSEAKAPIRVASTPPGAIVSLDGKQIGTTPLQSAPLAAGRYELSIELEGYEPVTRTVTVRSGRPERVVVELEAVAVVVAATPVPAPTVDLDRVYGPKEVDVAPKKLKGLSPDPVGLPKLKPGQEVTVRVDFVVTETGEVTEIDVVESEVGDKMNESVIRTLRGWKYEPGVLNGRKVKVRESRIFRYRQG